MGVITVFIYFNCSSCCFLCSSFLLKRHDYKINNIFDNVPGSLLNLFESEYEYLLFLSFFLILKIAYM